MATHVGLPVKKRAQERLKQSKISVLGGVSEVLGVHIVTWFDTFLIKLKYIYIRTHQHQHPMLRVQR